jgi:hypothetical protein
MAKSGRDVKQRFSKIEKRSTDIHTPTNTGAHDTHTHTHIYTLRYAASSNQLSMPEPSQLHQLRAALSTGVQTCLTSAHSVQVLCVCACVRALFLSCLSVVSADLPHFRSQRPGTVSVCVCVSVCVHYFHLACQWSVQTCLTSAHSVQVLSLCVCVSLCVHYFYLACQWSVRTNPLTSSLRDQVMSACVFACVRSKIVTRNKSYQLMHMNTNTRTCTHKHIHTH